MRTFGPLHGLRVLHVGGGLAGAYATKLLVDLGADATVIERPEGCSLRGGACGDRGAPLFQYLRSGCRSVVVDERRPTGADMVLAHHAVVDITFTALLPRRWAELAASMGAEPTRASVVVHISPFGQDGPRRDHTASGLTLQALAGWPRRLQEPHRPPRFAGGDIDGYGAGVFAAVAAMTAWRHAIDNSCPTEADVSAFACLVAMLPYPTVHAEILAGAGLPPPTTLRSMPGVVAAGDGWVGINPLNQQGWNDFCEVADIPELRDRLREVLQDDSLARGFLDRAQQWVIGQPVDTIVDLFQSMRIPTARVNDGHALLHDPQLHARDVFVRQPGGDFARPRAPWKFTHTALPPVAPAPRLGDSGSDPAGPRPEYRVEHSRRSSWGAGRADLPYSGLKVFDLSVYWAGPIITMYLASFGADVIKVESHKRPDPFRYSTSSPELGADWWERSAVWQGTNLGKRGLTLDLTQVDGQQIARQLIARADVLVENFTPRVLEHLGIDLDSVRSDNPSLIVVRLPGFGLDGPHRDHVAWAPTLEQASGLAHVTGEPHGPPTPPGGCADPLGGMHALVALQAALDHRDRTGEGEVIEMSQLEALVAMTAEQSIAASVGFPPPSRLGNRHSSIAPHGIYPCDGDDEWIAIAAGDDEWHALADALDRPTSAPTLTSPIPSDESFAMTSSTERSRRGQRNEARERQKPSSEALE
jgi:crotonobetainyl-CoA:carnitine CoA-transferase CaiB-like acyl-CoA transferase